MSRIVVVGAGVTGLTAAYRLTQHGHDVTVLEASDIVGGKLRTTPFAGVPAVDEGGDVFLARVPWATELCHELGLGEDLISPAAASASVWWDGRMHPIPTGLVLGVPAGLGGLARSRLLSTRGKLAAALEPLRRPRDAYDNVGSLIRARFGDEVLERLVDPLLGGINAGDCDHLSLSASAPQLEIAAKEHRSLLLGLRRNRPSTTGPVFYAPRGGMATIPRAIASHLHDVQLSTPVRSLARDNGGWRVETDTESISADAVLLAISTFAAADLLARLSPSVAAGLREVDYASVVMVTVAFPAAAFGRLPDGAGYLVPKPQQRAVTAVSNGTAKWPAWRVGDQVILRISVGRYGTESVTIGDDATLLARALADVRPALGLSTEPTAVRITRWDRAFPQYRPGHGEHILTIKKTVAADLPQLQLAGAGYEGIGVPACIRQGNEVARTMTEELV
jgi:protoporphyrinogen/coproporphyrinogen III oxidase